MAKNICFLGKTGIGKSLIISNLSESLVKQGYRILQVGNSICMDSTELLLGDTDISPVLEDFRDKYTIDMKKYIVQSASGVYCMELGGITPGAGCMARSLSFIDEMMDDQQIPEDLQLDYIFYDISGEIPCTGYILPIRDDLMDQCVIVTNNDLSSVTIANNLISGILHSRRDNEISVGLMVNHISTSSTEKMMKKYSRLTGVPIIATVHQCSQIEKSALRGKTVQQCFPNDCSAKHFDICAKAVIELSGSSDIKTLNRDKMKCFSQEWKRLQLQQSDPSDDCTTPTCAREST